MTPILAIGSLPDLLLRLWRHLSRRRQRQLAVLTMLMLISALAEVVSLGAVVPFLAILTAPDSVFKHPVVAAVAHSWGMTAAAQLVLPITIAFIAAVLLAAAIRMLLLWASTRFVSSSGADLSIEVYRRTLYQPYRVHVASNSSAIISAMGKVDIAVTVLSYLLTLVSSIVLLVLITLGLIAINPVVATVVTAGFGGSYAAITWAFRRRLRLNSRRIASERTLLIKALQEGLGGIRDVLLDGTQPVYCDVYRQADVPLRRAQANIAVIGSGPRFIMEALGMVLIAVLAYGLRNRPGGMATALPVLGALALGAQRLMPALQQGYSAWTGILGSHGSLADALELLDQPVPAELLQPAPDPLPFQDAIRFEGVRFRYASEGPWVLDDLNLTVRKGARVGFVGATGSGKSTALDLLMGLLTPTEGAVLVDGQPISGNRARAWQRTIAHVPQSIYLADTTIAENIAFGIPRDAIDLSRVKEAARQAHIADFIESRDEGYNAFVGERGVRLSGGQRQRIGIARALYKRASVLVFDEATSALDNATEQSVMEAIEALDRELTILLIAHRLTTVRRCDTIVEMEHGRVVAQGTYEQLLESSRSFRPPAHAKAIVSHG